MKRPSALTAIILAALDARAVGRRRRPDQGDRAAKQAKAERAAAEKRTKKQRSGSSGPLKKMTLDEKIGQLLEPSITPPS